MISTLFGIPVYTAPALTELVNVARSPSRALRRWRQGKRATNPMQPRPSTKAFLMGGKVLVAHPEMANWLLRDVAARGPTAIAIDMGTEPDRTVVQESHLRQGKSVVGSASRLAEFMDRVMSREGEGLKPWQRQIIAGIERALEAPPARTEVLARLSNFHRVLMESTERRILGMDTEQFGPSTLTLDMIRRGLNGSWPATDLPPRKEQC